MSLNEGISAIIPTYKGQEYIGKLLDSLKNQTLNYKLFEAIFIVNGELDNTPKIIEDFIRENPEMNIVLANSEKGVCNARNVGIELASRQYTIFIDDDDFISPEYFKVLLKYSKPNRIVIGTFYDVDEDTGEIRNSYLTPPLLEAKGVVENPYGFMKDILVITTDKLIPTENVKKSSFNPELKNGVDIGYYSTFYMENDFEFFVVDKSLDANYYRLWRDDSISRKPLSYSFNVTDRLKVINDINKGLKIAKTPEKIAFLKSLTGGQVLKINQYIEKHPDDFIKILNDISSYDFEFFPYKYLAEDTEELDLPNNELVISYAFLPTNTTSSNVVAKRILEEKKNVNVISATLNNLNKDFELEKLVDQFVLDEIIIDLPFENDWDNISEFVKIGMAKLQSKPKYDVIYSRAHFVHSHFLAYAYKTLYPQIYWKAEFSDPLIYNFNHQHISDPISDERIVKYFNDTLPENVEGIKVNDTINYICEYLTFIKADELIFTNENQKEVMIENFPKLKDSINRKAKIRPQPTLDEKYYHVKNSSYEIDDDYVNFAYFGVIFANRDLENFINAFDNMEEKYKDKFRLHLFTPNKTMFEQILSSDIFEKTVINPTISYLEFLNLTTKFDVLLVEDSVTKYSYSQNPFLPSKISDYRGSPTDIWAICERGSIMDKMDIKYKTHLNDYMANRNMINRIMEEKLSGKSYSKELSNDLTSVPSQEDYDRMFEYMGKRTAHLAQKIEELIEVAQNEFAKDKAYEMRIKQLEQEKQELTNKLDISILDNLKRKIFK